MATEFFLPAELVDVSADKIIRVMKSKLPDDIDTTEGGWVHDFIMPAALEKAELLEYWLPIALQTMFHMWAGGEWLDLHAEQCGLSRRAETYAYGDVEIEGSAGIIIPSGFVFSVPSENGVAAIDFAAVSPVTIPESGVATVRVKAVDSGLIPNVAADTITIMKNPLRNITRITNPEPMTGGTKAESDDSLRQRITDFYAGRGASFVGNKQDYERWAMQVAGVGRAYCVPIFNGSNTVKIVVTDSNGEPANAEICAAVELYIFGSGKDDINRLAPVGVAQYLVAPPEPVTVNISFNLKLAEGVSLETFEAKLRENLRQFYSTIEISQHAEELNVLRYVDVSKIITETYGVADFKHLRLNSALENVTFKIDEFPLTGAIEVTLYE